MPRRTDAAGDGVKGGVPYDVKIMGSDEKFGGKTHVCDQCKKYFFRNAVLICLPDPSMDWQESLNLHCFDCFYRLREDGAVPGDFESKKQWLKRCSAAWNARL
eukprot:6345363-Alexandrium_andersonii.AAC.1